MTQLNKNVALVLGSGGAKGYAHIGVIKALEEAGFKITSVAGTSMGSLIGGLYAAGKMQEAFDWLKTIDNWNIFKLADLKNLSFNGIINGDYIFEQLRSFVGDVKIEDLPIPFCAVSADLDSGKEVVFRTGNMLDAIRASISMPVFFNPQIIDGRRFVDGGVVNGLPINRVKRSGDDILVAINLDTYGVPSTVDPKNPMDVDISVSEGFMDKMKDYMIPDIIENRFSNMNLFNGDNMITILLNSYYIALKQNKLMMAKMYKPDIYLNIDLQGYTTNDFNDAETIANLGYEQMITKLKEYTI